MPYGWAEHTGELELWVTAAREQDVFAEALQAVAEVLDDDGEGAGEEHLVVVESGDRARTLASFIEELAFLAETEGFVPERVGELTLSPGGLRVLVVGRRGAPRQLVKAVTLHRLAFQRDGDGWRARVVIDV
jgi:SHS2 domain-containing protein